MSRIGFAQGWLLYANPDVGDGLVISGDVGDGLVISGDVRSSGLTAERAYEGTRFRITCELLPGAVLRYGGEPSVPLESMVWEAFQSWPDEKQGRKWPPEMLALLALARNHPEEFARLRDGEAVLRALGGL